MGTTGYTCINCGSVFFDEARYLEHKPGCDESHEIPHGLFEAGEELAKQFHEAYERLAPKYGYRTREASAVPWEQVPLNNRRLMIAVVNEIIPVVEKDSFVRGFNRGTAERCHPGTTNGPSGGQP